MGTGSSSLAEMQRANQTLIRLRKEMEPLTEQGFNLEKWIHIMAEEVDKSGPIPESVFIARVQAREPEYWPNRSQEVVS